MSSLQSTVDVELINPAIAVIFISGYNIISMNKNCVYKAIIADGLCLMKIYASHDRSMLQRAWNAFVQFGFSEHLVYGCLYHVHSHSCHAVHLYHRTDDNYFH